MAYGFELVVSLISKNEIQQKNTLQDELGRVAPTIAKIFTVDLAVERLRKEMINAANILILAPCCVASAFEFLRKLLRALAPACSGARDELARHEISGMRGNNVEEPSLVRGIAE